MIKVIRDPTSFINPTAIPSKNEWNESENNKTTGEMSMQHLILFGVFNLSICLLSVFLSSFSSTFSRICYSVLKFDI